MRASSLLYAFLMFSNSFAQWTEPALVDSPAGDLEGVNTRYGAWTPFATLDGQRLFYSSAEHDGGNLDIYLARWDGSGWDDPVRLPFCRRNVEERNPTVNATCDTMYFIGYAGGWDIFWCFRTGPEDTAWSAPERMPEPINSTGIESAVWATPDNQRLLLASWRISANGEDIYECRRDPTTATGWSDPVRLPGQLNTWMPESYPSMGFDTTELFWTHFNEIRVSRLTDSGWTRGSALPDTINQTGSESTPAITADGRRLYFSRDNGHYNYLLYSDRMGSGTDPRPQRFGGITPIRVYPNPAHDSFAFEVAAGTRRVVLYDILGRELTAWQSHPLGQQFLWSHGRRVVHLPSGTYILVADTPSGAQAVYFNILH